METTTRPDTLDRFIQAMRDDLEPRSSRESLDVIEARLRRIFAADRKATIERIRVEMLKKSKMGQDMSTVLPILDAEDER